MVYTGDWLNGERDGYGDCTYGSKNYTETYYKG